MITYSTSHISNFLFFIPHQTQIPPIHFPTLHGSGRSYLSVHLLLYNFHLFLLLPLLLCAWIAFSGKFCRKCGCYYFFWFCVEIQFHICSPVHIHNREVWPLSDCCTVCRFILFNPIFICIAPAVSSARGCCADFTIRCTVSYVQIRQFPGIFSGQNSSRMS